MSGNPPLYITRNSNGDTYVNNARIIPSLSVELTNRMGKRQVCANTHIFRIQINKTQYFLQVMHIIDEVLVPLTPKPNAEIDNIDALEFMRNGDKIELGGHNLRTYRSQVSLAKKESLFQAPGGHTFLVPVDAGFKVCRLWFLMG